MPRRSVRSLLALVSAALVGLCTACREEAPRDAHDDAGSVTDGGAAKLLEDGGGVGGDASVVSWSQDEVELGPDGRSAPLTFDIAARTRPVFVLRTYAADADISRALCFQLEQVRADSEALWVPEAGSLDYGDYCTSCEQRVAAGTGYGFFVLPSSAAAPATLRTIGLRIALRDCLTLSPLSPGAPMPSALVVESASFSAPARERTLRLPLVVVEATPHTFTAGAGLDETFARVREIWRAAGVELALRDHLRLPRPSAPVAYSATDRSALSAIGRAARALARDAEVEVTAPLVVLTPCLVRDDPLGPGATQPLATTAHVPGGFAVHEEPDAMFIAGERCGGLSAGARYLESDTLAAVIAHELGHYLGLFHVREPDGREDALADTRPDMPNLMQAQPSAGATALAETQIGIARRHPALAGNPDE